MNSLLLLIAFCVSASVFAASIPFSKNEVEDEKISDLDNELEDIVKRHSKGKEKHEKKPKGHEKKPKGHEKEPKGHEKKPKGHEKKPKKEKKGHKHDKRDNNVVSNPKILQPVKDNPFGYGPAELSDNEGDFALSFDDNAKNEKLARKEWKRGQTKAERLRQEKERQRIQKERKRIENEREKIEKERKAKERERLAKKKESRERLAKEKEKQRLEKEKEEERQRLERQRQKERERLKKEKEKERLQKEKEREKLEKERERGRQKKVKEREKLVKKRQKELQRKQREKAYDPKWEENYNKMVEEKGKSGETWEMEKDDKKKHYPKHLKDKVKSGHKIEPYEEDKFENEFGPFHQRNDTNILDIIKSVNTANDVTSVDEGDMVVDVPDPDILEKYKGVLPNYVVTKAKKQKKKKHEKKAHDAEQWQRRKRDARRDRVYLWHDRVVPYKISSELADSSDVIKGALKSIMDVTCIKFEELKSDEIRPHYIIFKQLQGCWSSVGRVFWTEGSQDVSLGTNCAYPGIIMHEVMHALGFWHEQSRPDRDEYVEIFWENIQPSEKHNFDKYGHDTLDVLHAPYDYSSIMHYGKFYFSMDSTKPTIISRDDKNENLGQRNELSQTDIYQLNALYDCSNTGTGWSNWSGFGPCASSCYKERSRFCMSPDKHCPNPTSTDYIYWGIDVNKVACPVAECNAPVDGHWNKWGSWGQCSVSCDMGVQTRVRECTDPSPKNGGEPCFGSKNSTQLCERRSCTSGPYDCTFEVETEPTCTWTHQAADFSWLRHSGRTPSSSTGPDEDYTSGSGHYLFIETSSPAKPGYKARLQSSIMSAGPRCMIIHYHMYGASIGSFNIYVHDEVTGNENLVFTKSGDQLNGWNNVKLDITADDDYKVIIEGERGDSFQGDMAIDDVSFKDGTCAGGPVIPTTPPPPSPYVSRVGCYRDAGYINGARIFPIYTNFRDMIDWKNLNVTANEIVLACSAYARQNSYKYFAIQYWGECWTGPDDEVNYGRDGEDQDCWPMVEITKGPFLVGKDYTAMVYKWMP